VHEYVYFLLDGTAYALDSSVIEQVLAARPVTFVPGCPHWIAGVIHLRGEILSIVSVRRLLGIPDREPASSDRFLLANLPGIRTILLVDSVQDIGKIDIDTSSPVIPSLSESIRNLAECTIPWREGHAIVLDASAVSRSLLSRSEE